MSVLVNPPKLIIADLDPFVCMQKVLRTKAEDDAKGKAEVSSRLLVRYMPPLMVLTKGFFFNLQREKLSEELTDQKNQVETLQEQLESSTKEVRKHINLWDFPESLLNSSIVKTLILSCMNFG